MCGIVGYVGRGNALKPVPTGLQNLEYRGYDSAGVAFCAEDVIRSVKQVGCVEALQAEFTGLKQIKPNTAIGHTRLATHGSPTKFDAHPHSNPDKTIFVVHNGIIENHQEIRSMLQSAGEMKHGPLALIDKNFPTLALCASQKNVRENRQ